MSGTTLSELERDLRVAVYRHLVDTGEGPSPDWLAAELGVAIGEVEAGLGRLADAHMLALAPSSSNVWMAHPFSTVPTDYPVVMGDVRYWANCAWDAYAIPALVGGDSVTETRCAETGEAARLGVRDGRPYPDAGVVHFLVRPAEFWDNVGFT